MLPWLAIFQGDEHQFSSMQHPAATQPSPLISVALAIPAGPERDTVVTITAEPPLIAEPLIYSHETLMPQRSLTVSIAIN